MAWLCRESMLFCQARRQRLNCASAAFPLLIREKIVECLLYLLRKAGTLQPEYPFSQETGEFFYFCMKPVQTRSKRTPWHSLNCSRLSALLAFFVAFTETAWNLMRRSCCPIGQNFAGYHSMGNLSSFNSAARMKRSWPASLRYVQVAEQPLSGEKTHSCVSCAMEKRLTSHFSRRILNTGPRFIA